MASLGSQPEIRIHLYLRAIVVFILLFCFVWSHCTLKRCRDRTMTNYSPLGSRRSVGLKTRAYWSTLDWLVLFATESSLSCAMPRAMRDLTVPSGTPSATAMSW